MIKTKRIAEECLVILVILALALATIFITSSIARYIDNLPASTLSSVPFNILLALVIVSLIVIGAFGSLTTIWKLTFKVWPWQEM